MSLHGVSFDTDDKLWYVVRKFENAAYCGGRYLVKKHALQASDALERYLNPEEPKDLNFPNENVLRITGDPEISPQNSGRKQTEFKGVREVNGEYRTHVYCVVTRELREKHVNIHRNASEAAAELRAFVEKNKRFPLHGTGWGQPIAIPSSQQHGIQLQHDKDEFGPGEYFMIKSVQVKAEATLDSDIVCELKKGDRATIKATKLLAEDPFLRLRGQLSYGGWITLKRKDMTFVAPCITSQGTNGKRKYDQSCMTPPRKRQRVSHSRYHGVAPWNGKWRGFVYLLHPKTQNIFEKAVGKFDTEEQAAESVRNFAASVKLNEKIGGPHIYGAKWGEPKSTANAIDNTKRSLFKHVYWNKGCNKWIVQQRNREGKRQHVGVFLDEYSAAQAADNWLLECYRGEEDLLDFNRLNFPNNVMKLLKTLPQRKKDDNQANSVEGNFMTIVFQDSPFGFTITRGQDGINAKVDTVLPSANAKGVEKDLVIRSINSWNAMGEKFEAVSSQLNRASLPCAIQFVRQVLLNSSQISQPTFLPVNSKPPTQSPVTSPGSTASSPRRRHSKYIRRNYVVLQPKSPQTPSSEPLFKVNEQVRINGWQKLAEINESYASMEPKGIVTKIFPRISRYEYKITLPNDDALTLPEERLEKADQHLHEMEQNVVKVSESIKSAREHLLREEGQLLSLDRQIKMVNGQLIQLDFRLETLRNERKKLVNRKKHYQSERQKAQSQKEILEKSVKEHGEHLKSLQQSIQKHVHNVTKQSVEETPMKDVNTNGDAVPTLEEQCL